VQRSDGTAAGYSTPSDSLLNLNCSRIYELSDEEKEKGSLTTVSRPLKIYTALPSTGAIQEHDVLVVNDENYHVVKVNRWPHSDPSFYEVIVDYRRGQ
jgi:hypothetical protein